MRKKWVVRYDVRDCWMLFERCVMIVHSKTWVTKAIHSRGKEGILLPLLFVNGLIVCWQMMHGVMCFHLGKFFTCQGIERIIILCFWWRVSMITIVEATSYLNWRQCGYRRKSVGKLWKRRGRRCRGIRLPIGLRESLTFSRRGLVLHVAFWRNGKRMCWPVWICHINVCRMRLQLINAIPFRWNS